MCVCVCDQLRYYTTAKTPLYRQRSSCNSSRRDGTQDDSKGHDGKGQPTADSCVYVLFMYILCCRVLLLVEIRYTEKRRTARYKIETLLFICASRDVRMWPSRQHITSRIPLKYTQYVSLSYYTSSLILLMFT